MLKRNIAILIAGGLLGGQVNLATAGESAFPSNDVQVYTKMLPAQAKYFDERAASTRTAKSGDVFETVKIDASTKYVTVQHFSTVKFVNDKGQSFIWTSDTLGEVGVRLKTIAPAGFEAGDTTIYVRHPAAHIPG